MLEGETEHIIDKMLGDSKKVKRGMDIKMKKFDENYVLLNDMYEDEYFPKFLVDKVKELIFELIEYLEMGEQNVDRIQEKLDYITIGINDLQDEFEENNSEIETVARDSIAVSVEYILQWFGIHIDIEDAIRERDW